MASRVGVGMACNHTVQQVAARPGSAGKLGGMAFRGNQFSDGCADGLGRWCQAFCQQIEALLPREIGGRPSSKPRGPRSAPR